MKRPKIDLYCTCGAHATITFKAGTTLATQQRVAGKFFAAGHTGEGHGPCDKRTADAARRKQDLANGVYRFGE